MHLRGTVPVGFRFHSTYSAPADVGLFIYLKICHTWAIIIALK